MSLLQLFNLLSDGDGGIPDNVAFIGGSKNSGSPANFSMFESGACTNISGNGATWEDANNPTPVDTYHVKWEDHDTLANPQTTPYAKSTWTALTGNSPHTWATTASAPDINTRGMKIFISNDGGSSTLASADVSMTADESP